MTVCANCGSPQGPFDRRLTGLPICGKVRKDMNESIKVIRDCNARRAKRDAGSD